MNSIPLEPPSELTLAVVGATGAVGRTVLDVLRTRAYVWGGLRLAASAEDVGTRVDVGGRECVVEALTPEFFDGVDVCLIDLPPEITAQWVEVAAAAGCVVVDNSPVHRMAPDVPLVVPEVNAEAVRQRPRGVISTPSATVITLIDALAVLHAEWRLSELVLTTYQAASGAGRVGMARLYDEIAAVAGDRTIGQRAGDVRRLIEHDLGEGPFPGPLALNVLPWVGRHAGDGWTSEEVTVRQEIRKVLDVPALRIAVTCVRVPVVSSHSVAVHARFEGRVRPERAARALVEAPMVVVLDDPDLPDFPTPSDIVGADPRFVGRIRQDSDDLRSLDFFCCGDNLRKGSALNMVQTAELVASDLTGATPTA